ncbi:MAG: Plasma membrane sulfite pump involved in sulfite metabolism [Pycnora praestabilis]|nr:MAG: Plasma membrane sulfite pump involved in sulfite metabolism [Pycnora praestabilis]
MYVHEAKLSTMTAAWLLPIVSTIVAAASGGIVAEVLPNDQHALITLIVSYVLWGTGVPLAMVTLVLYFQRLTVYALPPREVIVSVFLPLGPLGQGGFGHATRKSRSKPFAQGTAPPLAIPYSPQSLSINAPPTQTQTLHPLAGPILYVLGFITALILWGFGLVWFFFALASITRSRFPFNMGWWGFTFPIGVYTLATDMFGREMESRFFRVLGTVFSVMVVILWIIVSAGTAMRVYRGGMFDAPCLRDLEGKKLLPKESKVSKRDV